jgi:drug/metabolite transporter (DMT)-like permease
MTIGYLYAVLGLLSFGALGIFHKLADVRRCRPSAVSVLLYAWSLVLLIALVTLVRQQPVGAPSSVVTVAIPFGIAASVAILALQTALPYGNIATSWLAINLSAGVPTVASILVYHEPVNARKGAALVLIVISILLLWKDKTLLEQREQAAPDGEPGANDRTSRNGKASPNGKTERTA